MKKTYIKPQSQTVGISPFHLICISNVSGQIEGKSSLRWGGNADTGDMEEFEEFDPD